jgi:hypothetical protein
MDPIVPRMKNGGPLSLLCAINLISLAFLRQSIAFRE